MKKKEANLINVKFSKELKDKLLELEHEYLDYYENTKKIDNISGFKNSEKFRLHQEMNMKLSKFFDDNLEIYYIPAGRSLMTLMQNKAALAFDNPNIDIINKRFII